MRTPKDINVLVACEESQRVCMAFRKRGFSAWSCDIQRCSGDHPEWHIHGDCLPLLNGDCTFQTMDEHTHAQRGKWDLIIAHPPCTYLSIAGNRWLNVSRYGDVAVDRLNKRDAAAEFFLQFAKAESRHKVIENPKGYMNTHYRKPDQIVYPWQFGESNNKPFCFWLFGLPGLSPTKIVKKAETKRYPCGSVNSVGWSVGGDYAKKRSKTPFCIAEAMASQWGDYLLEAL